MATTAYSITQSGRNEPFELQVARGQISYHRNVIVFGFNPDVDTSLESVWPDGGTVVHGVAASVLKVSSTSASDVVGGVGAETIYIEGLDANYNEINESVELNGLTEVDTVNIYIAINNITVTSVGTTGHNVGDINLGTGTVTSGIPAVLWDLIGATYNQRTTGHYTVPAGHTGYLTQGVFTTGQTSGSTSVTGKLLITGPDAITRVGSVVAINNGSVVYDFKYPFKLQEKYCVGAVAIGSSANNSVSTMFNILLIKNDTST